MTFKHRDMTDAELAGIVGGLSWTAGSITKLQRRSAVATVRGFTGDFRGAVAAGTPPAAGPAKAPRCSGPWCA